MYAYTFFIHLSETGCTHVKYRMYYGITHGGQQVYPEHNFVILRRNDLKLGMLVHCHNAQCIAQKQSG